ncbi:MAG: hypothetical protein Q4D81_05940, partial [Eubacteriales bacterium]|nr:hypothetical protein [Eubacteriales bacterium]
MKKLLSKIKKLTKNRRIRRMLTRMVSVLAAVVVFVTTYALVLPAITMEQEALCGIPAHQHDDSCYESVLVCGLEESEEHVHTEMCYEKILTCGLEAHTHSTECYLEENAGFADTEELTDEFPEEESVYEEYAGSSSGEALEEDNSDEADTEAYEGSEAAEESEEIEEESEETAGSGEGQEKADSEEDADSVED